MNASEQCLVVQPTANHTHTIILLHGRGDITNSFASHFLDIRIPKVRGQPGLISLAEKFPTVKWIFPNAKPRYSTVFKEELAEWFDIASLTFTDEREETQKPGLRDNLELLWSLVQSEMQEIPSQQIVLGGISQGYATAAMALFALDLKFAGFVGLSGWMPFAKQIMAAVSSGANNELGPPRAVTLEVRRLLDLESNKFGSNDESSDWQSTPIFIAHENFDRKVDPVLGRAARDVFKACMASPEWHAYDTGFHWIHHEEIYEMAQFLENCFK